MMERSRDRRARSDAVQDSYLWRRRTSGSFGAKPEAAELKHELLLSADSGGSLRQPAMGQLDPKRTSSPVGDFLLHLSYASASGEERTLPG
jgi:hypothetical protein